ncbi:MAG TPA: hypothetical protein PLX34_22010 [Sedimentisphaerales bacterium]|jgi:uncharacterized membrane protein YkoI|nr:hypothetical protein [Sedimentisphaerales bacterium]HOH66735.1 hypothetical protein [Sedimentisphaerales bacterium]
MAYWIFQCVLVAALIAGLSGCGIMPRQRAKTEASAERVALSDVPAPARATIEGLTADGEIRKLEKEKVDGKVVYDVEATVGGKEVEYDVAADGTVLTAEESVPYTSLPAAVRAGAEKYFGSATGLKASREVEDGRTFYEVEGKAKGNGTIGLKLTDTGRIVEEEK